MDDRLSILIDARDRLITAMNGELTCRQCARGVDPPLAGVIRELRAVLLEIEKIPGSGEVTPLDRLADELEERRRKRTAG